LRCRLDHDAIDLYWHSPTLVEITLTCAPVARTARQRPYYLRACLIMSQNPLLEVELYAFASSSAQFYLTPHEFDVDLDGTRYSSLAIERNELALGAEAAKSALELKLPPNCELVRHLLASR
jgi:hypothetical protein